MRRGFADPEFLMVIAGLAIVIALCLPVLQQMRARQLSPLVGLPIVAAICLLPFAPMLLGKCAAILARCRPRNRHRGDTLHQSSEASPSAKDPQ